MNPVQRTTEKFNPNKKNMYNYYFDDHNDPGLEFCIAFNISDSMGIQQ